MNAARTAPIRLAPLALLVLATACARSSETVRTYDLVRILPHAVSTPEVVALDVGTDDARPWISGLSWNEATEDGTTFAWSDGPVTAVELMLAGRPDGALQLRGFPWPGASRQTVEVSLNGVAVDTLELDGTVQVLALEPPAERWATGRNLLELRYGVVRTPDAEGGDRRALGVAWDWIRIDRVAGSEDPVADLLRDRLTLPAGTLVEYALDLEPGSELVIQRLRGDAELVVALRSPDEVAATERARLAAGRRLRLPLDRSRTDSTWLTIANPGPGPLRLTSPRIEARR